MSDYTISVTNNSGESVQVAIYQTYPDIDGLPLVWLLQQIPDGNTNSLSWEINWALNWGTTPQQLIPGVQWTSGGPVQNMDPTGSSGNNAMGITFQNGQFVTSPTAFYDKTVQPGNMQVATDGSFTVKDSRAMSLAVYTNSLAAFVMAGQPNGTYLFETHPTYWICTTQHKQGVTVSGTFVTNPLEMQFTAGTTTLNYVLDDTLTFVPQN